MILFDLQSESDKHQQSWFQSWLLVRRCQNKLRELYKRQVDDHAWPPVKATNFINLALIKDHSSWRKTVQKSADEIIGKKTSTSYTSIFNDIKGQDIKKLILLEGRPGSGKTTLMSKISHDWAEQKILKSKLLIFVPLRRLNAEPDHSLATILRVACPTLTQSDVNMLECHIERRVGQGIVFAFDGLDEYVPQKQNEKVVELLFGKSLTKSMVIMTSRPAACTEFRRYAKKRIEVLGFLKSQIIEYVNHYFKDEKHKAQQLVTHMEQHQNLINMAYLPLHCAMLAFLYEEDTVLPETETEFYKHFTLSTLLRSKRKVHGRVITIMSFDQLPDHDKIIFNKICKLAFNATVESKQVFTSVDIKSILSDDVSTKSDMSSLGLVVIDRYFMKYGLDETYTFLHLTFQEYLAAVHIAGLSESQQMDVIKTYRDKGHLSVVWRFLCGMMDFSNPSAMDIFKSLMVTTNDTRFKLQCCLESQHSLPCTHVISAFCGQVKIYSRYISPSDCAAIVYAINKSDYQTVDFTFNGDRFNIIDVTGIQVLVEGLKNYIYINNLK